MCKMNKCENCPFLYSHIDYFGCEIFGDEVENKHLVEDEDGNFGCFVKMSRINFLRHQMNKKERTYIKRIDNEAKREYKDSTTKERRGGGYVVITNGEDFGCWSYAYKPCRKGGHTHNHKRNHLK